MKGGEHLIWPCSDKLVAHLRPATICSWEEAQPLVFLDLVADQGDSDGQQRVLFYFSICLSAFNISLRYESSTLIHHKELSSPIFQSLWVSQSVSQASATPVQSPLCAIYKGINALYWPSIINYQLPTPPSVPYWPSTHLYHLVTHSWAIWI